MFCANCGTQNEDDAKFCRACGSPLTPPVDTAQPQPEDAQESTEAANPQPQPNTAYAGTAQPTQPQAKKPFPTALVAAAAVVVAVIVVVVCVVANRKPTINLDKYLIIETSGYEGYGTASISIDWSSIEEKYGKKIKFTRAGRKAAFSTGYWLIDDSFEPIYLLEYGFYVKLDTYSGLSNGDQVSYTWNVDDDDVAAISKYLKCKVKYKDGSFKVSDLEELDTVDVFADVTVEFSGTSPDGYASINYDGSQFSYYDYELSDYSGLSNGDEVTVTFSESDVEYYAQIYGVLPESTEKTYTVEGLDEYVTSADDISDDFMESLKSETEDKIHSYVASFYSSSSTLSDVEYAGYIFESAKDTEYFYDDYNRIFIIYSGTLSSSEGYFPTTVVYYPMEFDEIMKSGDDFSYGWSYGICGYSSLGGDYWYYTDGYTNPLTCYADLTDGDGDDYDIVCGDGFDDYTSYDIIGSLDDISDDYKGTLSSLAEETINNYVDSNFPWTIWDWPTSYNEISDVQYYGELLLVSKDDSTSLGDSNIYVVVYSATVTNTADDFDAMTVYFPVEFDGIVSLPSGEFVYYENVGIVGESEFPNDDYSWDYMSGYMDGSELYSDIITANRDSYTWDASDEIELLGSEGA